MSDKSFEESLAELEKIATEIEKGKLEEEEIYD